MAVGISNIKSRPGGMQDRCGFWLEIRIEDGSGQRAKAGCSAIVQTVYQDEGQNGVKARE